MLTFLLRPWAYLPLRAIHGLGAGLGWMIYWGSPRYAARLRENLRASKVWNSEPEYQKLLRQAIREAGKGALEVIPVWLRSYKSTLSLVKQCNGWEHVEQAIQRGRGIIYLTPHLGCFEIAGLYCAAHYPITTLYRPPKLRWLESLMKAGRTRGQVTLAATDLGGVRALLKALKRGETIGMLPDQVPGVGEGVWAEFFAKPAYTMTLVGRLAQTSQATILMVFAERLPDGKGYEITYTPFASPIPADKEQFARLQNQAVEVLVRQRPAQYLWSYNRYKIPRGVAPPGLNRASP